MCSLICESVRWCVFVVHKCVCLHKSVGLDVDVHVFVQIHVGGCIIGL